MKESIRLLFLESLRLIKSIVGLVVLVGGGLVPGILYAKNIFSPSGYIQITLVFVIGFLIILLLRICSNIDIQNWFDKRYERIHQVWKYELSEDKRTFVGECISERKLTSLSNSLEYITISIGKDQVLIPFQLDGKNNIELLESFRDKGKVVLNQAHKTKDSKFSFRVYFTPPLKYGESAYFKVKYVIDNFKVSNLDDLRSYMTQSKIETRDYEYNSFTINYPTDDFRYEICMPKQCKANYLDLLVQRGASHTQFEQERDYVRTKNMFMVVNEENCWRMVLHRKNPPIKTRYVFSWRPTSNKNDFG